LRRISVALIGLSYLGVLVAANALTASLGLVPAGFGLLVTAGTCLAGLALGLRDVLHESIGVRGVLAMIAVGTLVTSLFSLSLAMASAAAFLFSELLDLLVYARLRVRGWHSAVVASNFVGSLADTHSVLGALAVPDHRVRCRRPGARQSPVDLRGVLAMRGGDAARSTSRTHRLPEFVTR
jgi:queuosine precursor transporter